MKISIFENATLIGEATVFALDPPMCVAMANLHQLPPMTPSAMLMSSTPTMLAIGREFCDLSCQTERR